MSRFSPDRPPRIGQLAVYCGLFDEAMPPKFRRDQELWLGAGITSGIPSGKNGRFLG